MLVPLPVLKSTSSPLPAEVDFNVRPAVPVVITDVEFCKVMQDPGCTIMPCPKNKSGASNKQIVINIRLLFIFALFSELGVASKTVYFIMEVNR